MLISNFTVEEINLIAMYLGDKRAATVAGITAAMPHMDVAFIPIAESAVAKLSALEEQDYTPDDFTPTDDYEGEAYD